MKSVFRLICLGALGFGLAVCGWGQSSPDQASAEPQKTNQSAEPQKTKQKEKQTSTPAKEMGKGGEDLGKGVAKGTGDLAKGTAGGVG